MNYCLPCPVKIHITTSLLITQCFLTRRKTSKDVLGDIQIVVVTMTTTNLSRFIDLKSLWVRNLDV